MHRNDFANRLKQHRIRQFKTMRAFAREVGINENSYARYERDGVIPLPATLAIICTRLGISTETLIGVQPVDAGFAESGQTPFGVSGVSGELTSRSIDVSSFDRNRTSATLWRVATILSRARGFKTTDLRAIAVIFRNLQSDPFGYLASTLSEIDEKSWTKKLKSELDASIAALLQHFERSKRSTLE